jgi:hypothetical protein
MPASVAQKADLSPSLADRNLTVWALLAGAVIWGGMAWPMFAGRVYSADDLGAFHLPVRAFYADRLAHGQPYEWMPQLFCGFYLTGEGQGGPYHPLHQLLYRFLSLPVAFGLECLLPYPLIMIGTWLFLRRRLACSAAAAFGGLLFAFSSFNLLHFVHPNAVAVIAHVPWLLWAIDVVLVDSRRRRVAWATALIALLTGSQLLLGYPQYVWYSLVAEFTYVIFIQIAHRYSPRSGCDLRVTCSDCIGCTTQTWPRVLMALGIGLLLGAVQLLPSLDAWLHSARLDAGADFPYWGSLHPLNVLQLLAPYLFVGRVLGDSTHEFGLYVGAVPLVLIVWLVARRRELGSLAPATWTALGFALLMLVMSFGKYGFLYPITTWIPVVGSFRFPCRSLVLLQLAVAFLAAIAFALLTRQSRVAREQLAGKTQYAEKRRWWGLWRDFEPLWCLVGLSAAVAVAALKLRHEAYVAPLPSVLAGPALLAAAALLTALAARGHWLAIVGLIVLAAVDLGCYGLSYSVCSHNATWDAYVASAHTPPGQSDDRVVASLFRVDQPGLRTGDLMTLRGWRRADGYAGLEPRRQLDYRLLPALRVAGVRWVQRNDSTLQIAGLKPRDDRWLEVPDPLPRVRMVTQTRVSRQPAADVAQIRLDTTALCEVPLGLPASDPGKAVLADDCPGRLAIEVDAPASQLLVVAESYHNGWHAAVDDQPEALYRVNGDFMGCVVGPGKHHVVLTFQPGSLQRGRFASLIGLALLSICFLGSMAGPKAGPGENELP